MHGIRHSRQELLAKTFRPRLLPVLYGAVAMVLCVAVAAQTQGNPSSTDVSALQARARRQLQIADLEMSKVSPATQATVLLGLGRAYSRIDKKKSAAFLERAYEAALHLNELEALGIGVVQNDVIAEMARLSPERVEQNLPADPRLRDTAAAELIRHYTAAGAFDRAIELLQTMIDPDWIAQDLLMSLSTRREDRNQVFAIVLNSYRRRGFVGPGRSIDLGTLLIRFWRDLRPALVNEAADELLRQADPKNNEKTSEVKARIIASSGTETAAFANFHEFRLFQLLPILKVTDPERADVLLREHAEVSALMNKYPQGQQSFDPTLRDTPTEEGEISSARYSIVRGGDTGSRIAAQIGNDQAVDAIVKNAQTPEEALNRAKAIGDASLRARSLVVVAEQSVDSAPDVARSALRLALEAKTAPFLRVAKLCLRLNDSEGARKAVERGMANADGAYKRDADPDAPNEAIRLLWPSVQAWRDLIDVANSISPDFAVGLIDTLPDPEARPLERTFLAGRWLGVSPWSSTSPFFAPRAKR
jgi:hypothetical protein